MQQGARAADPSPKRKLARLSSFTPVSPAELADTLGVSPEAVVQALASQSGALSSSSLALTPPPVTAAQAAHAAHAAHAAQAVAAAAPGVTVKAGAEAAERSRPPEAKSAPSSSWTATTSDTQGPAGGSADMRHGGYDTDDSDDGNAYDPSVFLPDATAAASASQPRRKRRSRRNSSQTGDDTSSAHKSSSRRRRDSESSSKQESGVAEADPAHPAASRQQSGGKAPRANPARSFHRYMSTPLGTSHSATTEGEPGGPTRDAARRVTSDGALKLKAQSFPAYSEAANTLVHGDGAATLMGASLVTLVDSELGMADARDQESSGSVQTIDSTGDSLLLLPNQRDEALAEHSDADLAEDDEDDDDGSLLSSGATDDEGNEQSDEFDLQPDGADAGSDEEDISTRFMRYLNTRVDSDTILLETNLDDLDDVLSQPSEPAASDNAAAETEGPSPRGFTRSHSRRISSRRPNFSAASHLERSGSVGSGLEFEAGGRRGSASSVQSSDSSSSTGIAAPPGLSRQSSTISADSLTPPDPSSGRSSETSSMMDEEDREVTRQFVRRLSVKSSKFNAPNFTRRWLDSPTGSMADKLDENEDASGHSLGVTASPSFSRVPSQLELDGIPQSFRRDTSSADAKVASYQQKSRLMKFFGEGMNHLDPKTSLTMPIETCLQLMVKGANMLKYTSTAGSPHHRLFRLDPSNMIILWYKILGKDTFPKAIHINSIKELRRGQRTKPFEKDPWRDLEGQSFSLIYGEWQTLDLICDSLEDYHTWTRGLEALIYSTQYHKEDGAVSQLRLEWLVACPTSAEGVLPVKKAITLVERLSNQRRKHMKPSVLEQTIGATPTVTFDQFVSLYTALTRRPEILKMFEDHCARDELGLGLYMDAESFYKFLVEIQCETEFSIDDARTLIQKFSGNGNRTQLDIVGFTSFLHSDDNSLFDKVQRSVCQDMTLPLSQYFIASSHNTYLLGDQLKGESSVEAYIRALVSNCRCVELDCWDGSDGDPIITHGHTLTTKIKFRDVIIAINEYAFKTSPYPVILSLENHCSKDQQETMVQIMRDVFQARLVTETLFPVDPEDLANVALPSPEQLKYRILVKARVSLNLKSRPSLASLAGTSTIRLRTNSNASNVGSLSSMPPAWGASTTSLLVPSLSSASLTVPGSPKPSRSSSISMEVLPSSPAAASASSAGSAGSAVSTGSAPPPFLSSTASSMNLNGDSLVEEGTAAEEVKAIQPLADLAVYCQGVSFVSFVHSRENHTNFMQSSFGETKAKKICVSQAVSFVSHNRARLSRVYPSGSRFNSSNFDPQLFWNCGIQMVALNYQTNDAAMFVNRGMFSRNGGCGMILKPINMRSPELSFDPQQKTGLYAEQTPSFLSINVIAGLHLSDGKNRSRLPDIATSISSSVVVEIRISGVNRDTGSQRTSAVRGNTFDPEWNQRLDFQVVAPELATVGFFVWEEHGRSTRLLGHEVVPFVALKPGYRHIRLRTHYHELLPFSCLYVHSSFSALTNKVVSMRGSVHRPDSKQQKKWGGVGRRSNEAVQL
ncbi:phospholipase C delta 4 [Capsaspora owczarzaki ATCC 30864]|uniref:Phosphoinositide phospholipase C n=1 Tax=Capsaspora owczarzaki (strain ATCC 30864) TaxID=595528 RepID=A0A0D2UAN0_CAPO3|nr:phospholipase C delta 4 [Capsaspora owczarzaki ATCC 30864]KJE92081.1 phospholipase C delta 4 [Capsaspora owczarzaki ATCC 30864]|eukprot:XP_004363946.2 phospholipase C delta 4 [Capsaspora owczarzaki ATCC 30864]